MRSSEEFISQEYPWFLDTFLGYEYNIQRADAIRYFALEHFGGIYVDLDDGCNRSLEPLLAYPSWVRKTKPTGISNDVMGAVPGHPFFRRVIQSLQEYDISWGLPYVTVMSSTGPLFLSMIWRHWTAEGRNVGDGASGGRVRILFPEQYMTGTSSFFTHHVGNSWHSYDVELMFWMLRHWIIITIVCFIVGFTMIFLAWLLYDGFIVRNAEKKPWRKPTRARRFSFWSKERSEEEQDVLNRHAV
ncbi:hypothetical protein MRB53_037970 [Persea americana]|nr:hypothetical protein MRB53_037970 [Persea americana]